MRPRFSSYPLLRMRKPLPCTVEAAGPFPALPPAKQSAKSFPSAKHVHPLSPLPKRSPVKSVRSSLPLEALRAGLQQSRSAAQSPRVEITQEIGHAHRTDVIKNNLKAKFYGSTRKPQTKRSFQTLFQTTDDRCPQPDMRQFDSTKGFCRSLPVGHNSIYYREDRKAAFHPAVQLSIHPLFPIVK